MRNDSKKHKSKKARKNTGKVTTQMQKCWNYGSEQANRKNACS